ncbi:B12-binding domain-containing radical SAM protein [Nannocystis pusilla]|uniref:Radical SAM protein n=1 Tax=Nannocystis pusilla TaxID=889268 RepID=A0ABS7TKU4_9BACT|nr:radical SAM protein [Nannocystis pusilla]MBZ5708852.1 radical SAM protein [Nannocystis pusilla]
MPASVDIRASVRPPEVLLLFPPATEARLFPYLSLPVLTAYLRREGVAVRPRDLNIELCHALLAPATLRAYLGPELAAEAEPQPLERAYRSAMARYLLSICDSLRARVFDKAAAAIDSRSALRLAGQAIDLLLERSALKFSSTSLSQLAARLTAADEPDADDLAARALAALLDDALARSSPAVVGISVAFYSQIGPALWLARRIRARCPDAVIVLGGPQIMLRHDALARVPAIAGVVDALATGAGEATLVALARAAAGAAAWSDVPSVVWLDRRAPSRDDPPPPIAALPPPDFTDLPWQRYVMDAVQLPLVTGIGCFWGRCAFCSYGARSRRVGYQQKSPRQIADECEHLVRTYDVRRINFVDEMTNLPVVRRAMRLLRRRGVAIEFSVRCRFERQLRDLEVCRELRALGCVQMAVGYETNSQRLLDRLDKGVDAADYQPIVDNLHAVGIELRLSVMGGILDETAEEVAASEAFLAANAGKIAIDVMQMLTCEPGTPLAERPEEFGVVIPDRERWQGNELLSYGLGRVGLRFEARGAPPFEAMQRRFLAIHHNVHPHKNDDVPPERRGPPPPAEPVYAVQLHPWVRVVRATWRDGAAAPFLANLLWQTIYRLPPAVRHDGELLRADGDEAARVLARLLATGAGTPVRARRSA